MNPAVKAFLCGSTSIIETAITSISSLVNHEKSTCSTNQANLFDHILIKHIAMYYECRFTKLGYSVPSILQSLLYLDMLLNHNNELSNQYIDIVLMLLDSEFFSTELQLFEYFTHVEYLTHSSSQEELLETFPCLFNNLKCDIVDTLKDLPLIYLVIILVLNATFVFGGRTLVAKCCN